MKSVINTNNLIEEIASIDTCIAKKTREMERRKKFQYELCRSLLLQALENESADFDRTMKFHYISEYGDTEVSRYAVVLVPLDSVSSETAKYCDEAESQTVASVKRDISELERRKSDIQEALDYAREAENWDATQLSAELFQIKFGWLSRVAEQDED